MSWWPRSWRQFWSTLDGRTYHLMLSARPWIGWLAVGSMVVVFGLVFWWVPLEAVQGYPQKIFYIHVPSAWVMYAAFGVVFASSILYLWKRTALWDIFARCAAEVGFLFTTLALVTGQSVTDVSQNAMANLGWDDVRLPAPVFEGDTIYSQSEVVAARPSSSRPEVGIVTVQTTGYNQDGRVVITFRRSVMVYRRDHAPSRPRPILDLPGPDGPRDPEWIGTEHFGDGK